MFDKLGSGAILEEVGGVGVKLVKRGFRLSPPPFIFTKGGAHDSQGNTERVLVHGRRSCFDHLVSSDAIGG